MLGGLFIVIALGVVAFFALGWWSRQAQHSVAGPGADGRLARCGAAPNCVCSDGDAGADAAHWIAAPAWPAEVAPDARSQLLRRVVEELGGVVVREAPGYLHATFTSRIFGFVDDLELRADDSAVAVRSASRVGHSDLGANRQRVEALRAALARAR